MKRPLSQGLSNASYWVAAVVGVTLLGWDSPVQAAPQLRYRTLQLAGTPQACLARGKTALARAGFTDPATSARDVIGETEQLMATVVCQRLGERQVQTTVMVAAAETVAPAMVRTTLETIEAGLTGNSEIPSDRPTAERGPAMSPPAFTRLMAALEDSWPDYLEFLAQPVSRNYFTAAQASRIVEMMRFPDDRVDAALLLYPRVVDLGNWFLVEQALRYDSSREELRERLPE